MANYCSFEIRIKGKRGNTLLLCHSIPTMDGGSITYAKGTDDAYEVHFRGSCKWSVNFNVTDDWEGSEIDTDLNALPETIFEDIGSNFWDYSLRAKSRALECEVQAHYWSEETGFDYFDHFVNGRRIKKRRIAYTSDNYFDWSSLEFIGHEGEIDKNETSEAQSLLYANRFVRHFDAEAVLSVLRDQDDDVIEISDDEEDEDAGEDEVSQKLEELLEQLKQLNAEMGIEDDSEDDDDEEEPFNDEETDGSETELLDVGEYWLTPSVRFAVPDGFAIEKSTVSDGEVTISIKGGECKRNGKKDYLLTGVVHVLDIPYEEQALQGQQWIDHLMQEEDGEEKQYVQLPGTLPALLWSKKLPTLDLPMIKFRPFIVQLQLRTDHGQRVDIGILTNKEENYDGRYFYLALLEMLEGFHVDGKTLNCTNLTDEMLYSKLEPIYEEDLYSELRSDETKRISTSDWSVCLPVGFCETKSPVMLAKVSDAKLLVPEAFAYTDSEEDIPVKILIPSSAAELDVEDVSGYIDIPSKQGIVRFVAVDYARELAETNGHSFQIVTAGSENAGMFILFASSQDTTIAKCGLMTLESICEVTVIADIDASMAEAYVRSIGHWLSTFEFTQSKWKTEKILLEEPECLEATLQGCFDKFDEAVEQLVTQYLRTASGNLQYLKYMQTLHGMDINIMKRNADNLLRSAFETKALGVNAASAFVEKLKLRNASEDVLKHIYTKLVEFEPACEGFQIELADDESNDTIELENGTKITQVFHRVMHDTQIVRVNEPLSIKAAIAKWKQVAGTFNPPVQKPGFMSSLEFIRAKQEIEERSAQLTARIEEHIEANPVVIIPGKKFVFTGLGVAKEEQKNHPVVKELEVKGGLFRSAVSGVTDYLVVGNDSPGETKINAAIAQQENSKPIHIIRLKDLEVALGLRLDEASSAIEEFAMPSCEQSDLLPNKNSDQSTAHSDASLCAANDTDPLGFREIGTTKPHVPTVAANEITLENYDSSKFLINNGVLTKYTGGDETVIIPSGVRKIGAHAFAQIHCIEYVFIPSSVESIEESAFYFCSVKAITFSEGLKTIGKNAFDLCNDLPCVDLPSTVTSIGEHAFYGSALVHVRIPVTVNELGERAISFSHQENLGCLETLVVYGNERERGGIEKFKNAIHGDHIIWESVPYAGETVRQDYNIETETAGQTSSLVTDASQRENSTNISEEAVCMYLVNTIAKKPNSVNAWWDVEASMDFWRKRWPEWKKWIPYKNMKQFRELHNSVLEELKQPDAEQAYHIAAMQLSVEHRFHILIEGRTYLSWSYLDDFHKTWYSVYNDALTWFEKNELAELKQISVKRIKEIREQAGKRLREECPEWADWKTAQNLIHATEFEWEFRKDDKLPDLVKSVYVCSPGSTDWRNAVNHYFRFYLHSPDRTKEHKIDFRDVLYWKVSKDRVIDFAKKPEIFKDAGTSHLAYGNRDMAIKKGANAYTRDPENHEYCRSVEKENRLHAIFYEVTGENAGETTVETTLGLIRRKFSLIPPEQMKRQAMQNSAPHAVPQKISECTVASFTGEASSPYESTIIPPQSRHSDMEKTNTATPKLKQDSASNQQSAAMPLTKQTASSSKPIAPVPPNPNYRMARLDEEPAAPSPKKKEGCYIATAVYGSYDAPEVLVLRRFRDETLKKSALGRWFIRTYYRWSPAVAKKLRTAKMINGLVRKGLDGLVRHLQNKV